MLDTIPVVDFSRFKSDPEACALDIVKASRNIGFFYLKNHGISQELIDRMFDNSEQFFQQPLEKKTKYLIGPHNIGYSGMKSEKLDPGNQIMGDLKEAYNIRKYSTMDDSAKYFVLGDAAEQVNVDKFFKELHQLAGYVMQCFAMGLQIPESFGGRYFFDKSLDWEEHAGTTLRFLHYPPQNGDPDTPLAGSHTDYGSITLLMQKDIPGLEVQAFRAQKNAPWVAAPVIPGTILVNIADHLQMWTNGLLRSTKHRVMYNPEQQNRSRYSIACFIHSNDTTKLDPIESPLFTKEMRTEGVEFEEARNMTAGEYLDWRLSQTYDYSKVPEE